MATVKLGMKRGSLKSAIFRGWERSRERKEKADPGPGPGDKYSGLYQDRIPGCNFMGEENEINLGNVIMGCPDV